jgi:hypothetical protein
LHLRDAAIKGGNQFEQFTDDARAYHRHLPPLDRSVRERVALEGINAKPFIGPSRERCLVRAGGRLGRRAHESGVSK